MMTELRLPPSGLRRQLRSASLGAMLALASSMPAHAADALNGKSLYLNGPPGGGVSCASCHGSSPASNVNGILSGANNPALISSAWAANLGGMGVLYNGKFTAAQIADLAAFIGDPNVTAAPVASLTPASLTFSGTTVGQAGSTLGATLANAGSAVLNLGTIGITGSAAADYSIAGGSCANGGTVAAGASCSVLVAFKPTATGIRAAVLHIGHNATGGDSTVSLSGTGNALPQATIGVSATSVDFGALLTNVASATQTVTVSNSGQAALAFSSIALGGANPGVFTLGGSCTTQTPVAAGASCTLTVQALPTSIGTFSATINLASNAANGSVTIGLAGSGAAPTLALAANPSVLAFGSQTIGSGAVTQNVTLSNTGNAGLNFTSIGVAGAASLTLGAGSSCGATLAVGASCTIPVVFTPTAEGKVAGTLLVRSNAPNLQVELSGAAISAAVARPTLSDNGPIAFADTQIGNSAAVHSTVLSNTGSAALKIATLVLGGANAGDFVMGGSCSVNGTLSPAASCTIDIAFKPSAAGARSADLLLVTDSGAQLSLHLSGNGIAIANSAALTITPQSFDFGAATVGGGAPTKRFTLINSGTSALALSSVTFSGPFSGIADATGCPALPFALQPGAACELVVRYAPTTAGAASGSVLIQGDATASWTIALAGSASAPAAPATVSNRGGGGCSAARDGNDPVLALLVVLALGVIGWRRREARRAA
jgi:uncharacterized protein (TIGR03382 family)